MERYAIFLLVFSALVIASAACSEVSPNVGRFFQGRTLTVSIQEVKRGPELRYTFVNANQERKHYRIAASSDDVELSMLRISVGNYRATSAVVNIDVQSAQLLDFGQGRYIPINVLDAAEEVGPPENPAQEQELVFLWNTPQFDGSTKAYNLEQGYSIEGWMLFETPKDVRLRELRWRAGDSLTIEFWPG